MATARGSAELCFARASVGRRPRRLWYGGSCSNSWTTPRKRRQLTIEQDFDGTWVHQQMARLLGLYRGGQGVLVIRMVPKRRAAPKHRGAPQGN